MPGKNFFYFKDMLPLSIHRLEQAIKSSILFWKAVCGIAFNSRVTAVWMFKTKW
ncbi:hypothetical protein PGB90_006286 [Kerria lacca]